MSTPSDAVPEPAIAPAALSATRPLYWSVRRELWENRSLYAAPLIAAAVVLFGFSIRAITLPRRMPALLALDPSPQRLALITPYSVAAVLVMFTTFVVGLFYCLEAVHGERRDRSILFWKSLPVSDLTTVLSKASVPLVVLPVLTAATVMATQLIMLLLNSAVLLAGGWSAAALWRALPLLQMWLIQPYGLAVHALWFAPLYGWLLLVSSWARRAPFLWAVLPPLALGLFERIAFQTTYLCALMKYRVMGAMTEAFTLQPEDKGLVLRLSQLDPLGFLGSPGLWLGLAAAAAFLAAAARLRRNREPI